MLTAREATMSSVSSEMADSMSMSILAGCVSGIVSVGLNAAALVKAN
jgi:hypothetical protein